MAATTVPPAPSPASPHHAAQHFAQEVGAELVAGVIAGGAWAAIRKFLARHTAHHVGEKMTESAAACRGDIQAVLAAMAETDPTGVTNLTRRLMEDPERLMREWSKIPAAKRKKVFAFYEKLTDDEFEGMVTSLENHGPEEMVRRLWEAIHSGIATSAPHIERGIAIAADFSRAGAPVLDNMTTFFDEL